MKITFKSKNGGKKKMTAEEISLIHDFVEFSLSRFIPKRSLRFMNLEIVFNRKLYSQTNAYGTMEWLDRPKGGNHYAIEIDGNENFMSILCTIGHELVHVKQSKLGECYDINNESTVFWNKRYVVDKTNYWELPWEIEAHGRSVGLVRMWIKDRRYESEKWAQQNINY
jgi:hypothetical protein